MLLGEGAYDNIMDGGKENVKWDVTNYVHTYNKYGAVSRNNLFFFTL